MSDEEIESLIEYPRDIHFDAEQVLERWENMQVYREQQFEKMQQEMLAEIRAAEEAAKPKPAPKAKSTKKTTKSK